MNNYINQKYEPKKRQNKKQATTIKKQQANKNKQ